MSERMLSEDPTRIIGKDYEYQHVVIDEGTAPSQLLPILQKIDKFLQGLTDDAVDADIATTLNEYGLEVVDQLQLDNTIERKYTSANLATLYSILAYKTRDLTLLAPVVIEVLDALKLIFEQYERLLEYVPLYAKAYAYNPVDDDPKHITYYRDYTDKVTQDYVTKLQATATAIDKVTLKLGVIGLYKFLITMDITQIEPNTQIEQFAAVIQAVQNNRIYKNREEMIIAVGDAVSVTNLIRLTWLMIQLNYQSLTLDYSNNEKLYDNLDDATKDLEDNPDSESIDRLLELTTQTNSTLEKTNSNATIISQISANTMTLGKIKDRVVIYRHPSALDSYLARITAISAILNGFNLELNYSGLQGLINKMLIIQTLLNSLLSNTKLSKYITKINDILANVSLIMVAVQQTLCLVRQAMCLVASLVNFIDTILTPAIANIKGTISNLSKGVDSLFDDFSTNTLTPFDNAVKRVVYEQARVILKGRGYELASAIGKTTDTAFLSNYSTIVDAVVDRALGNNTSALDYLKKTASQAMHDIADSFTPNSRLAVNCAPISLRGSLSIPSLSLQANIPSINSINLQVGC